MDLLRLAGDALWVVSLSMMASASRAAWGRIKPEAKVPLLMARGGGVLLAARRGLALTLVPAIAFSVGLALMVVSRSAAGLSEPAVILFGVRATVAPLFAIVHLRWLAAALRALGRQGALKP